VTASYPPDVQAVPELVLRRRVTKVANEVGEMLEALEGYTGENPRKGVYATREDVVKELLDCASAALCAVEHMTGNCGVAVHMLVDRKRAHAAQRRTALQGAHAGRAVARVQALMANPLYRDFVPRELLELALRDPAECALCICSSVVCPVHTVTG
jgi:NTP pyrophosphatase (non-canonical NTP hydrolase)